MFGQQYANLMINTFIKLKHLHKRSYLKHQTLTSIFGNKYFVAQSSRSEFHQIKVLLSCGYSLKLFNVQHLVAVNFYQ